LIGDFSDLEWWVLAAVSPAIRADIGVDLAEMDDAEFNELYRTMIEARARVDALIGEIEEQFEAPQAA
jgi:hypothetical protein